MFETILILGFSCALFAYWFRYTVLLLLSEEQARKSEPVMEQLSLFETQDALARPEDVPLEHLHTALEKDYRLLRYLLDHAAGLELRRLEHHLLILDYRLMALWYWLTRHTSTQQSRRALDEMAGVLSCMASKMGGRSTGASHA